MFLACQDCSVARQAQDFVSARGCHACKGTGIVRDPASYVCNKCGGSLCLPAEGGYPHGLIEARVSGGFNSKHLFDLTSYTFSLCEACLRVLFEACKVAPKVVDQGSNTTYAEDAEMFRTKQWRAAGGHLVKLAQGLCNEREACPNKAVWRHFVSDYMTEEAFCEEHKRACGNSHLIPAKEVADVPVDKHLRTSTDRRQIVEAWLRVACPPSSDTRAVFFRWLPACVRDLLEVPSPPPQEESDLVSMLWCPEGCKDPSKLGQYDLEYLALRDGVVAWGTTIPRALIIDGNRCVQENPFAGLPGED